MTLKEINAALVVQIKGALKKSRFEGIKVDAEDISENVKRPSLKILCEGKYTKEMQMRTLEATIELFFFPEDSKKFKIDNAEMQELLQAELLKGVPVPGEILEVTDIDFTTTGKILSCNFLITSYWQEQEADTEKMDHIEWRK